MNILIVNPETPTTFWSFENAISFISKKASDIPLGLITMAAMLPSEWNKTFIDMNIQHLDKKSIEWADYVFLGGMSIQIRSFQEVIGRCHELNTPVVAGGPLVTLEPDQADGIDHLILNEAEWTLPAFVRDLENGTPQPVYRAEGFPELDDSPIPDWSLLDMHSYAQMSVQYSRGCPFDCEFCSITLLNGHTPRTKKTNRFLAELDSLFHLGWRGAVFIVDDNFIGNKRVLKTDLLPALIEWSGEHGYPFQFTTEVSINLADDEELMEQMVQAGFIHTFIGIETTNEDSLTECGKKQNRKRDMIQSVKTLQSRGLRVSGGFIVGFDHDPPSIFEQQIRFIQKSGIVTAMVGLLNAPRGTRLFNRLKSENRLLTRMTGDNMDGSLNFMPRMNMEQLLKGYKHILESIYAQKEYYQRLKVFLRDYRFPSTLPHQRISWNEIQAFFRSVWHLGIQEEGRWYYWKLVMFCLFRYPKKFSTAITMSIYGFHFRRIVEML
jgi:radical SAM superfamily enzyme YgiQ (UPF0313 family)